MSGSIIIPTTILSTENLNITSVKQVGKAALQGALREPLIMVTGLVVLVDLGWPIAALLIGILAYNRMNFLAVIYAFAWLIGPFWGCLIFLTSFFCRSWFLQAAPTIVVAAQQRLEQQVVDGIKAELQSDFEGDVSDDALASPTTTSDFATTVINDIAMVAAGVQQVAHDVTNSVEAGLLGKAVAQAVVAASKTMATNNHDAIQIVPEVSDIEEKEPVSPEIEDEQDVASIPLVAVVEDDSKNQMD